MIRQSLKGKLTEYLNLFNMYGVADAMIEVSTPYFYIHIMINKNITASEARKIALAKQKEMYDEELDFVIELINDHSQKEGDFVLRLYNKTLRQDVREELVSRGFEIHEAQGGINETDTIIKW